LLAGTLGRNIGLKWSEISGMLRLSKKTDYALLALQHLASKRTSGVASAGVPPERFAIPLELLATLQQRARRGSPPNVWGERFAACAAWDAVWQIRERIVDASPQGRLAKRSDKSAPAVGRQSRLTREAVEHEAKRS
jgi:hypothetical protein